MGPQHNGSHLRTVSGSAGPVLTGPAALVRSLGLRALTAGMFNLIVGAGIFVLPAKVAVLAGPSAPLVFVVCGMATALVLTCFAIPGSRVSLSGGPYAYIEHAFGQFAGFLAGFIFWTQNVLSAAAVANAFAHALTPEQGLFSGPGPRTLLLAVFLACLAITNVRGTKHGARLVEVNTVAKLLPLVLLIVVGAFFVRKENLAGPSLSLPSEFGSAALLLFFAFGGGEMALRDGFHTLGGLRAD